MPTKKMLAILASPKKKGNLAKMLDHAMNVAKQKDYEVHFISLYDQNIAYCNACMRCRQTGTCYIQDDIKPIEELLKTCDVVVMASPTYFANIPAPAKNLFDRMAGIIMDDNNGMIPKPLLSKKQGYLLLTSCSTPFPFDRLAGQSTGTLHAMKEFFKTSGMRHLGNVTYAGTKGKTEVPTGILKKIEKRIP